MKNLDEIFTSLWESCAFKREKLRQQTSHKNIFDSLGFVLAADIRASRPLPPFDSSAMDGYATLLDNAGKETRLLGCTLAGEKPQESLLRKGFVQKVMTGSPLPKNTQAVVPIELVQILENGAIKLPQDLKHNQNIRLQGEEIAKDSLLLDAFKRLKPLDLGMIASQGLDTLCVCKKPKIALFSTGDEVIEPGLNALPHQIYNTNAISIMSILKRFHHDVQYHGILSDKSSTLLDQLQKFSTTNYDVIITTGGASVGDADMIKSTLHQLGAQFVFDGVNLKPGRHLSVVILNEQIFILLPGNPLASLLHIYTIILSFLEFLSGARSYFLKTYEALADSECILKPKTQSILLGNLIDGKFLVFRNGKFGSSALRYVWENNAIVIVDNDYGAIKTGSKLKCLCFDQTEFEENCNFINTQ
ncbi:MAG: molybdopterin molybdotransferase MoeA [Helicobacter sp.]|nr:molybdopterin molybdotransferase MoeA [Helicobacter sp.]MDY5741148.1 molybdopterin molybdotransferase MoeA [Helicobacter sp.]